MTNYEAGSVAAFEEIVLRHSADAAMLLHPRDGVVYASPAMAHVIGIDPADFLGKFAGEWVHPDDVGSAIEHRRQATTAGHSGPALIRGRHGDGTFHWFEAEWWHLSTEHTVMHLRDAQRNHTAIEHMSRELGLARAILEYSDELVIVVQSEWRVAQSSPSCTAVLAASHSDLEGKDWRSFVHPDDHESLLAAMQRSSASKSSAIRVQVRFRHRTNVWFAVQCTVRDLTNDPRVGGHMIHAAVA
jgi:PAS domain S-box-containing protein